MSEVRVPAPLFYIPMVFEGSLVFPKSFLQRGHCHEIHYNQSNGNYGKSNYKIKKDL